MVDGCWSKLVNIMSVVLHYSVSGPVVSSVHLIPFIPFRRISFFWYVDNSTLLVVLSPGIWDALVESLDRDLNKVSECCGIWRMKLNASKTKTTIVPRSKLYSSPVVPHNYWWNCDEGVWWPCYIGSSIWFQGDFWEASSLGFQSSFSKAWYLEEVHTSI